MQPLRAPRTTSTISQLRREFGVTARALRFYEEQGLLAPVRRQDVRLYSQRDRARLKLVISGRRAGFSLRAIRDLLDVYDKEGKAAQLARALPRFRAQLDVLEAQRRQLDAAIDALKAASVRLAQGESADGDRQPTQRQA